MARAAGMVQVGRGPVRRQRAGVRLVLVQAEPGEDRAARAPGSGAFRRGGDRARPGRPRKGQVGRAATCFPLPSRDMTPLRLGSHYQLEERIGEGSLGVVWRGSDTVTGVACAIKLLRPENAQDPATVARFVRERTALLRFRHPNVGLLDDMIVEGAQLALVRDVVADGGRGARGT